MRAKLSLKHFLFLTLAVPLAGLGWAEAWAQDAAQSILSPATITFTLDFPASQPEHYVIEVAANGEAAYHSQGKLTPQAEGDPFETRFVLSPEVGARVFQLAKQAGYFAKPVAYTKGNLAFTGEKTLVYRDGQRNYSQSYNYSSLQAIQELTSIFQNMATTLEFGRRLTYYHSYQKLALDEETRRLEELLKSHSASEPGAIEPVLRSIAADNTVIRMVRERVERLLRMAADPASR